MAVEIGSSPTTNEETGSGLAGAIGRGLRSAFEQDMANQTSGLGDTPPTDEWVGDWPPVSDWSTNTSFQLMAQLVAQELHSYLSENSVKITDDAGDVRDVVILGSVP